MKKLILLASFLVIGCGTQSYGQCEAPNDHFKIMFKPKIKVHPFSHSFCIVCNAELELGEYGDWAIEMGAPQAPDDIEGVLPCLYVYNHSESEPNTNSLKICKSLVCGGGAAYNDMVYTTNKNFDLAPLLNP